MASQPALSEDRPCSAEPLWNPESEVLLCPHVSHKEKPRGKALEMYSWVPDPASGKSPRAQSLSMGVRLDHTLVTVSHASGSGHDSSSVSVKKEEPPNGTGRL